VLRNRFEKTLPASVVCYVFVTLLVAYIFMQYCSSCNINIKFLSKHHKKGKKIVNLPLCLSNNALCCEDMWGE
jgi:hypothetical protein